LTFRFDHEPPVIKILRDGRIKDAERLRVSYYHGMGINRGQVTVCMSEPKVHDIWAEQAKLMQKYLAPKKYLLSMDEIRAGGACEACKRRGMTMGQILADCITRQVKMIRAVNPKAEVFIWSDMLDPFHNAHNGYYGVIGDFTGSWKYVPKDVVIMCWYHDIRDKSLPFFSKKGFTTMGACYYDTGNLANPKNWIRSLASTPKAIGIMYTTWRKQYDLLGPFAELLE